MRQAHKLWRGRGGLAALLPAILGSSVLSGTAVSAPWEFDAVIDVGAIYTDNLRLQADGLEEDETIYMVVPSFALTTDGDRLEADLRYRPEGYFYTDAPESDEVFHVVEANGTATLVRDALFLFASANNFQSIVSPGVQIPVGNVPISGNRADATVLEVRPYWEQNLGFADILAEVSYVDTVYDELDTTFDTFLQDNNSSRTSLNLNNHERQQGLAWGVEYQYRRTEYDAAVPWDYQRAGANLGYWVNASTRLFVSGGAETAFDNFLEPDLDDSFWEAGFQYRPTRRLDLEVAVGERGYGESYRTRFSYQLRRGRTEISYRETPTTLGEVVAANNPITGTDNLDDILNRPGGSDRFISKSANWLTTLELAKTDLSLRFFFEDREELTTAVGGELPDESIGGVAFRMSWRIGGKSTLGFSADYTDRDSGGFSAQLERFSIDYSYQLSRRFNLVLRVQRADDDFEGATIADYVENQAQLTIRTTL